MDTTDVEEAAMNTITALIDIIEREIAYNVEFAPQRAEWMQEALATALEGFNRAFNG